MRQKPVHVPELDDANRAIRQRLDANRRLRVRQDVTMQIAEITGVLKGEDAPASGFFRSVGTGCPREENLNLIAGIGFANDIVVRSDAHTTLHRLEKNPQIRSLRSQAFQLQLERRLSSPKNAHLAPSRPPKGETHRPHWHTFRG
jgi:hypothetical protein